MDPYRSARKVEPPPPALPRDLGMSSLGLVMVLGALLSASSSLALSLTALLAPVPTRQVALALVGLGLLVRAAIGGWAGWRLVIAHPRALSAVRTAGGVALAQSVFTVLLAMKTLDLPLPALSLFLLGWPACYVALSQRRAVRARWASAVGAPKRLRTRDLGMEGVGVLARALGVAGATFLVVYGATVLFAFSTMKNGWAAMLGAILGLGLLLVRTILHARLGAAARVRDASSFVASTRRYHAFAWVVGAATTLVLLLVDVGVAAAVPLLGVVVAWPVALRVYAKHLAHPSLERRIARAKPAEEAGVTALGILLLAVAALWIPLVARGGWQPGPIAFTVVEVIACAVAGLAAALGSRRRRAALLTYAGVSIVATVVNTIATIRVFAAAPAALSGLWLLSPLALEAAPLGLGIATLLVALKIDRRARRA